MRVPGCIVLFATLLASPRAGGDDATARRLLLEAEAGIVDGSFGESIARYREFLALARGLRGAARRDFLPEAELAMRRLARMTARHGDAADDVAVFDAWSNPPVTTESPASAAAADAVPGDLAALARFLAGEARLHAGAPLDDARRVWAPLGFLEEWRVVGPFDNERGGGFLVDHGPETTTDLEGDFAGKKRRVSWRRLPARPIAGRIDLDALLRPNDEALAYALTFVHSPRPQPAALRFSSDEGYRVWLNDSLVASADLHRSAGFDQTAVRVELRQGWNVLLFKVTEAAGSWEFRARLDGVDGTPLPDLKEGEPPGDEIAALLGSAAKRPLESVAPTLTPSTDAILRARLATAADDARAHYLLGALHLERGAHDAADHPDRDLLRRAVEIDSGTAIHHLELARTHEWQAAIAAERDDNDWREALEEAARLGSAAASVELAAYYFDTFRNVQRAGAHLDEALARNSAHVRALLLRGEIEAHLRFPAARRRALARAVSRQPASSVVLFEQAVDVAGRGAPDAAEAILRQLLARNRLDSDAADQLVELLLAQDKAQEAIDSLEQDAALRPFSTASHEEMARIALGRDDPAGAARHLEAALRICPECPDLVEQYGDCLRELGEGERAIAAWRRVLDLQPNSPLLRKRLEFLASSGAGFEAPFVEDADAIIAAARREPYKGGDDDPARVLLDLTVVEVNRDGTSREFAQRIVEILSDRGVRAHDRFTTYYAPGEQVLEFTRARVVRADGSEEEARLSRHGDGAGESASSRGRRRGSVDLPALSAGDIYEVRYVREDTVQGFFGDYFGRLEIFQESVPIERKVFHLVVPADRAFYFHRRNLQATPEKKLDAETRKVTYTWTLEDVAKLRSEPARPSPREVSPTLEISTFRDWDAFATWYWNLIKKQFESSPEIERKVRELTSGLESDRERIRALYNFVVSDIRYNAWEFGVHGFKPYKAATVFARRFGDCKDKATLLGVMLAEAGIRSHPVLIHAAPVRHEEDLSLPMVHHFNHCITFVPAPATGEPLFLDGTAAFHSADELPSMDRGARVLVVRDDGAELRTVPWNEPRDFAVEEEWTVDLAPRGGRDAEIRIRLEARGEFAVQLRRTFEIEAQRHETLEKIFARRFAGARILSESFSDLARIDEPVSLSVTIAAPRFLDAAADGPVLSLPEDLFATEAQLAGVGALEERTHDVLLGPPRRARLTVTYRLPAGLSVRSVPEDLDVETRAGRLRLRLDRSTPGTLRLERWIELTAPRVEVEAYSSLRELAAAIDRLKREKIRLEQRSSE